MDETLEFLMEGERVNPEEASEPETEVKNETQIDEEENVDETEVEETEQDETTEVEEESKEEPKKDKNRQILDSERAKRKNAEKKLRELQAEMEKLKSAKQNEEKIQSEKENLKQKLMQDDMIDEEVADRLISTIGEDLIKQRIQNEAKEAEASFDKEFNEFSKDEMYYDAEDYKDEIKALMSKGLSMKSAYFALAGENKMANIRKDLEVEIEQKLLNNSNKAEKVNVGHEESKDETKRTRYTKREQEIANELGIDVKDVHNRLNTTTLDEILNL